MLFVHLCSSNASEVWGIRCRLSSRQERAEWHIGPNSPTHKLQLRFPNHTPPHQDPTDSKEAQNPKGWQLPLILEPCTY